MMSNNYAKIVRDNLKRLFENLPEDLARALPAQQNGDSRPPDKGPAIRFLPKLGLPIAHGLDAAVF